MQIPILRGIYAKAVADFKVSYPINLIPVPIDTGLSSGYLRTSDGVMQFCVASGPDRGSYTWKDKHYRVSGSKLVHVTEIGNVIELGSIPGSEQCAFDESFDRLSISNGHELWYWDGITLTHVTDPDLGEVIDHIWVDGYFMCVDKDTIKVTELNDPTKVDPLKYGSSEVDPDRLVGLVKPIDEVYVFNRYSMEVFQNVGGNVFPFERIAGAAVKVGLVGSRAKAIVDENGTVAFVGSCRNSPPRVFLLSGSTPVPISTRSIDEELERYNEAALGTIVVESRVQKGHKSVYIRMPDRTAVYDLAASEATKEPVWYWLSSTVDGMGQYNPRNFAWVYGKWLCGDPRDGRIGYLDDSTTTQYGEVAGWQFDTALLYNESRGAIVQSVELVGLPGRAPIETDPVCFHSWTHDGVTWSDEKRAKTGKQGDRQNRIQWRQCGKFLQYRGMRFRGANQVPIAFARLEAVLEPLA